MTIFIAVSDVDAILGITWAPDDKKARAVLQANAYLTSLNLVGVDIDAFRVELEYVGLIVESFADQELARPEGELGPIADRLFQVFEAVNAGVESLIRERDGEAEKAKTLQHQVDDLLQQAAKARLDDPDAKEVADLKAKLDEAKVPYRANASKESLEKLIADLPKA